MQTFKLGDIVNLKSGSDKMTVVKLHDDDKEIVTCQWFQVQGWAIVDGNATPLYSSERSERIFHVDTLER